MWQRVANNISAQLTFSGDGRSGWFLRKLFRKHGQYLVRSAVDMCEIQPHHTVLEVGYGQGMGLKYASQKVKGGSGIIYGVDHLEKTLSSTAELLFREIKDNNVALLFAGVEKIPLEDNVFDRVYHVNCYHLWQDVIDGAAELYRVMKPHGLMVTAVNLDVLKIAKQRKLLSGAAQTDPLNYMVCLEAVGFRDVSVRYLTSRTGLRYEAIVARIHEKAPREVVPKPKETPGLGSDGAS